jgi:hypothetical protein
LFNAFHPELPPCTYDPPPFLRCRTTTIGLRPKEVPPKSTIGPGTYNPVDLERPHVKVYRASEPPREVYPHLKVTASLPDPGKYYTERPFWTPSVSQRKEFPPRKLIVY